MMTLSALCRRLALACCLALLVGCVPHALIQPAAAPTKNAAVSATLARCQSEVAALQHYDAPRYQQRAAAMSSLLDRSAQYLLMRDQLSTDSQMVIDSVYQARLARDCQQIHIDLFNAMLAQADAE